MPARGAARAALRFGLAWAVLPPLALWTLSQLHPFWNGRYLVMTLPGAALAVASLLPRRPAAALAALAVPLLLLGAAGLPVQREIRGPVGHTEDVRGTAQALARNGRPGDAVLFVPAGLRTVLLGYPQAGAGLDDVALAVGPRASDTLTGVELGPGPLARRLAGHDRLWVVSGSGGMPDGDRARLVEGSYRRVRTVWTGSFEVTLYERLPGTGPQHSTFAGGGAFWLG